MRKVAVWRVEKGFTLIEVVVVSVFLALIIATVALYYTTSVRLWKRSNDQTEVQQQARIALSRLVADLQQATSVSFEPGGDWLELKITQPGGEMSIVRYYRRGNSLIRDTGGYNPVAMYITQLEFNTSDNERLIKINLAAAKDGVESRLETTVFLRNLGKGE